MLHGSGNLVSLLSSELGDKKCQNLYWIDGKFGEDEVIEEPC